jgi:uncharacterized protein with HEPN domain
MRHESLYFNDIVEAVDHIAEFIAGAIIGEAARNRCPVLREQVARILAAESAGAEDEGGR